MNTLVQLVSASWRRLQNNRHAGAGTAPRCRRTLNLEALETRRLLATLPTVVDPNLAVREAATGLITPISMAFLGDNDMLVLEKNTGKVQRVQDGAVTDTVLDLPVNFASERGLLGIALHSEFEQNQFVYLYWSESSTGEDSRGGADVPLLGNRVDRFVWDGSQLAFDQNIILLRAFQNEDGRNRGNHDGGVIRFGQDGKLLIIIGDVGRRGQMQNLVDGPFGPGMPDDDFGGPEPDDAHLTGVILRLNDDGTAPEDNPFFELGEQVGGEVGANLQKVFAYGIRNGFGMAIDPKSGDLWVAENADDAFDEINRVEPGMNGGWIQIMGPVDRIGEFKAIETDDTTVDPVTGRMYFGLQQSRWLPTNIADTPEEALASLNVLPGSEYSDPEFSWKFAVAPGGLGFLSSRALGPQYQGDMFVGAARTFLEDGYLLHFNLTGNRRKIGVDDPRLEDRVADNAHKFDITESEELLFGSGFGIGTDIQTGPNGNLFVVSLSNGAVYEIHRVNPARKFEAELDGSQEVPPVETDGHGAAKFRLKEDMSELRFKLDVQNIQDVTQAHIHIGQPGSNGPPVAFLFGLVPEGVTVKKNLAKGTLTDADIIARPAIGFDGTLASLVEQMRQGNTYVNVHTIAHPAGEIRGQIVLDRPSMDAHDRERGEGEGQHDSLAGAERLETIGKLAAPSVAAAVSDRQLLITSEVFASGDLQQPETSPTLEDALVRDLVENEAGLAAAGEPAVDLPIPPATSKRRGPEPDEVDHVASLDSRDVLLDADLLDQLAGTRAGRFRR